MSWFASCGFQTPEHFNPAGEAGLSSVSTSALLACCCCQQPTCQCFGVSLHSPSANPPWPPPCHLADFFADLVARDRRTPEADAASQARIQQLVARFQEHQAGRSMEVRPLHNHSRMLVALGAGSESVAGHAAHLVGWSDMPGGRRTLHVALHPSCRLAASRRRCPRPPCPQAAAVPQADEQAMQQINDRPAFPNRWPVEFGLLLRRAWKQQSRDRLPQARPAWALARLALGWMFTLGVDLQTMRQFRELAAPSLHTGPVPQMITLMQTLDLGFVLAALFSDIPNTAQGVQDELGVSAAGSLRLMAVLRWLQRRGMLH